MILLINEHLTIVELESNFKQEIQDRTFQVKKLLKANKLQSFDPMFE